MNKTFTTAAILVFTITFVFATNTLADGLNIPITADQAFNAVAKQIDPATGVEASVALIDVRTTAEYFWVGACGKVNSITTVNGRTYVPRNGKVKMKWGKYLTFRAATGRHGRHFKRMYLPVKKVASIDTMDISIHIPTHFWDEANSIKYPNPNFAGQIEELRGQYEILILMCRSGKRSDTRAFNTDMFQAIYEIDQPNGATGNGGFQGPSYGDAYNGYRGFPGRNTRKQNNRSVSWYDAGLPVHIGWQSFPAYAPPYVEDAYVPQREEETGRQEEEYVPVDDGLPD